MKKLILSLMLGIFLISLASAWQTSTFNNSLGSENLSLIEYNPNLCYQETFNISTSCGGLSSGDFTTTNIASPLLTIDGDWNTYSTKSTFNAYIYVNYTVPFGFNRAIAISKAGAVNFPLASNLDCYNGSTWYNAGNLSCYGDGCINSILIDTGSKCFNNGKLQLRYHMNTNGIGNGMNIFYEEAVNWTKGYSQTRYLQVPQNTVVINANMNLSGYNVSSYSCYQETANQTNSIDGSCGLNYNGYYINSGGWQGSNGARIIDGDWGTNDQAYSGRTYMYMNYFKPINSISSIWEVKDNSGTYNYTILDSCFNYNSNNISLRLNAQWSPYNDVQWECYNGTWNSLSGYTGAGIAYEEAIIWEINIPTYPTNASLSIDNTQVWNYTGTFNQINNPTTNIASYLNTYLATCSFISGYCYVPFNFASYTQGILGYSNMNFDSYGTINNGASYNNVTYETAQETFTYNFSSTNIVSTQAVFYYNGTAYTSTVNCGGSTNCIATNTINIPLLTSGTQQNRSFYWTITTYDGSTSFISTSPPYNQTVNQLTLTSCSSGNIALNFTSYDEQNKTRIMPFSFDSTFNYYLGTGGVYKTLNITTSANEVDLCLNINRTYYLNAIISYSAPASAVTYTPRNWFFQNYPISNVTQNIALYLLKSSASTSFIINVQDATQQPYPGVLVNVQRCYPGTNTNETVFISRTDSNGLTTGNFEAETALYQFFITLNNSVLLAVTPCAAVIPQTVPYTLLFQIGNGYQSPFLNIDNVTDLTSIFYFNYTSNILTWTYIDTSGQFNYSNLVVTNMNASGSFEPIVCNITSNQSSAILTCNITQLGSYTARGYIYRTNGQRFLDQMTFTVQTFSSQVGYYGVFLGFFIILICAFAFKFSEIAGIILVDAAIIFCNMFGLIAFGNIFITAIICISIIIVAVLDR